MIHKSNTRFAFYFKVLGLLLFYLSIAPSLYYLNSLAIELVAVVPSKDPAASLTQTHVRGSLVKRFWYLQTVGMLHRPPAQRKDRWERVATNKIYWGAGSWVASSYQANAWVVHLKETQPVEGENGAF